MRLGATGMQIKDPPPRRRAVRSERQTWDGEPILIRNGASLGPLLAAAIELNRRHPPKAVEEDETEAASLLE